MKTTTILSAWDVACTRHHNLCLWAESGRADVDDRLIKKLHSQMRTFESALLSRIEAGDRARDNVIELLDVIEKARIELECDNPGMAYQILARAHEPRYDDEELENEREHYELGGSPVYTEDTV